MKLGEPCFGKIQPITRMGGDRRPTPGEGVSAIRQGLEVDIRVVDTLSGRIGRIPYTALLIQTQWTPITKQNRRCLAVPSPERYTADQQNAHGSRRAP